MKTGLERLLESPQTWLKGRRVGLVANPTTWYSHLRHAVDSLHAHCDVDLTLLFEIPDRDRVHLRIIYEENPF